MRGGEKAMHFWTMTVVAVSLGLGGCVEDNDAVADDGGVVALGDGYITDGGGAGALDGAAARDDGGGAGGEPSADAAVDLSDASPRVDTDATPGPDPDAAAPPAVDAAPPPVEDAAPPAPDAGGPPFSFFVTSLQAMRTLSGSEHGFGGDLGGLAGADAICQTIAEGVGQGHKTWRAFLSATEGPDGQPVHAIERIGQGPWYDANGRLVAENIAGLLSGDRPAGDPQTIDDLPDEYGVPISVLGDAHDVVTGSNPRGRLDSANPASTCNDWTSAEAIGQNLVKCGHSFPRMVGPGGGRPPRPGGGGGAHWLSDHPLRGCTPGVNLIQNGPGTGTCIGCSGGYGAIYCFALSP